MFSYQIDKMGYVFANDNLPVAWIKKLILNHHVEYMYSDSEKINCDREIANYIDELILEKGSIKVFRLKTPQLLKGNSIN